MRMQLHRSAVCALILHAALWGAASGLLLAQQVAPPVQPPDKPEPAWPPDEPPPHKPRPNGDERLAKLLKLLGAADVVQRRAQYDELIKAGPDSAWALPAMLGLVAVDNARGESTDAVPALEVIGAIGPTVADTAVPMIMPMLIGLDNQTHVDAQPAAARALLKLGDAGRDAILASLGPESALTLRNAQVVVELLKHVPRELLAIPLARVAVHHPRATVRRYTQRAVVWLRSLVAGFTAEDLTRDLDGWGPWPDYAARNMFPALLEIGLMQDRPRELVQFLIGVIGAEPLVGATELEREFPAQAMQLLMAPPDEPLPSVVLPDLVAVLTGDAPEHVRRKMAFVLRRCGAPAVAPLMAVLRDDASPWMRASALESLGAIGDAARPAVPLLIELLRTPGSLRAHAASAFRRVAPVNTQLEVFVPMLGGADDPDACGMAIRALASLGAGATAALIRAIADRTDDATIESATSVLVFIGVDAMPELRAAVSDRSALPQRLRIVRVLGRMADATDDAAACLRELTDIAQPDVAAAAKKELAELEVRRGQ
ncbi:MAG: HEAT repeat domain-containing protein [Planctomycetota bacterium]